MKAFITAIIILFSQNIFAQKTAVTDKGEEVILYDNGTWKYKNAKAESNIKLDTIKCVTPAKSTFLLKGEKLEYGVYLDSKKWKFKKNEDADSPTEYNFTFTGEDAYAMIIPERIEIPLDQLQEIALSNAIDAAPDTEIVKEEYRIINGMLVKHLQMNGTISGIKFTYLGYYYSSEKGAIQFITYTSQNLLEKYRSSMEDLLNGLTLIK